MADWKLEQLKERIKYETSLLGWIWVTAVAVLGGSIGLLVGELSALQSGLAGVGIVSTLILIVAALRQDRQIRWLLAHMEETQ